MLNDYKFLKTLTRRDVFYAMKPFLSTQGFNKIEQEIIKGYDVYFSSRPEVDEIKDYEDCYFIITTSANTTMTTDEKDLLKTLFLKIKNTEAETDIDVVVKYSEEKKFTKKILDIITENHISVDNVRSLIEAYDNKIKMSGVKPLEDEIDCIFPEDLDRKNALSWALPQFNLVTKGGICKPDLILVVALSNVGKTQFCTAQVAHSLTQLKDDEVIIYIGNEEVVSFIVQRILQVLFKVSNEALMADKQKYFDEYKKILGGTRRLLAFDGRSMTTTHIQAIVRRYNCKLMVIDIGSKLQDGRSKDLECTRLGDVWRDLRIIAGDHCPIITTHQAGGDASFTLWEKTVSDDGQEGKRPKQGYKRYLDYSNIYNSHIAITGNCDLIIGIGRDTGPNFSRYFNFMKNKVGKNSRDDGAKFIASLDPDVGMFLNCFRIYDE